MKSKEPPFKYAHVSTTCTLGHFLQHHPDSIVSSHSFCLDTTEPTVERVKCVKH